MNRVTEYLGSRCSPVLHSDLPHGLPAGRSKRNRAEQRFPSAQQSSWAAEAGWKPVYISDALDGPFGKGIRPSSHRRLEVSTAGWLGSKQGLSFCEATSRVDLVDGCQLPTKVVSALLGGSNCQSVCLFVEHKSLRRCWRRGRPGIEPLIPH